MTQTTQGQLLASKISRVTLGYWSLYFLIKIYLYLSEYIDLNALYNLAFAMFLIVPLRSKLLGVLRTVVAIPVAVAMLYQESWLPPFHRVVSEATLMSNFDADYTIELLGRLINPEVVAFLIVIAGGYLLVSRYLRVGIWIIVYLALNTTPIAALWKAPVQDVVVPSIERGADKSVVTADSADDLNRYLDQFYATELQRQADFTAPAESDVPFDILFVHVCSLSWEDIESAQLTNALPAFDILLQNFNTVASYSGPAAIRILRASCGQSSHGALYQPAPQQCYLFDELAKLGFENELLLNHDGHFDDFIEVIQRQKGMDKPPMNLDGLKVSLRSFDGSPIYNDGQTLERWIEQRDQLSAARVAGLYNTITLHDGNRFTDNRSRLNSQQNFEPRLRALLGDLNEFFVKLEESGRRILVVMVPEHGAATQGDKLQIAGLREIPSPAITLAPVGLRLFGPGLKTPLRPVVVEQPTSFLAMSDLIARLIASNPFGETGFDAPALASQIEETAFVSENAGTVVVRHKGRYYVRLDGSRDWIPYPTR